MSQDLSEKVGILIKYFNMYGYGNFDLFIAEIEQIISYVFEHDSLEELETKLKNLYERLAKDRLG